MLGKEINVIGKVGQKNGVRLIKCSIYLLILKIKSCATETEPRPLTNELPLWTFNF